MTDLHIMMTNYLALAAKQKTDMTLLHDAYAAYLSGLTTKKNENEIWWKTKDGYKITVELVNLRLEKYIVRDYYDDGSLWSEENYRKGQLHGRRVSYFKNGKLRCEENYYNSQLHGLYKEYYEDGSLMFKISYDKGQLHGPIIEYRDGNIYSTTTDKEYDTFT